MKVIGLEEHFVTREVLAAWHGLGLYWQDPGLRHHESGDIGERLRNQAERRIADMDDMSMDVQVPSLTAPVCKARSPKTQFRCGYRLTN